MTTPPPFPTPAITDAPNIPVALANTAQAFENQAVAAYNGYNTTNNPSATTLENRINAIDAQPGGTAAGLDGQIATLSTNIANNVGSSPSSALSTEVTRTAAFGARQDGHDSLMTTINSNLNTYEPQINNLIAQRPGGLLYNSANNYSLALGSGAVITSYTFTPRQSCHYRIMFTGSFLATSTPPIYMVLEVLFGQGTTPPTSGSICANASFTIPTSGWYPVSIMGSTGGLPTTTYTFSIFGYASGGSGNIGGMGSFTVEDLGYKYY